MCWIEKLSDSGEAWSLYDGDTYHGFFFLTILSQDHNKDFKEDYLSFHLIVTLRNYNERSLTQAGAHSHFGVDVFNWSLHNNIIEMRMMGQFDASH